MTIYTSDYLESPEGGAGEAVIAVRESCTSLP